MRKIKKILSLVLVFALVMTCTSFADTTTVNAEWGTHLKHYKVGKIIKYHDFNQYKVTKAATDTSCGEVMLIKGSPSSAYIVHDTGGWGTLEWQETFKVTSISSKLERPSWSYPATVKKITKNEANQRYLTIYGDLWNWHSSLETDGYYHQCLKGEGATNVLEQPIGASYYIKGDTRTPDLDDNKTWKKIINSTASKKITIGKSTFKNHKNLKSINLKSYSGKLVIEKYAFKGCTSLKTFNIGKTTNISIGKDAFKNVKNINLKASSSVSKSTLKKIAKKVKKAGAKKVTFTYKKKTYKV